MLVVQPSSVFLFEFQKIRIRIPCRWNKNRIKKSKAERERECLFRLANEGKERLSDSFGTFCISPRLFRFQFSTVVLCQWQLTWTFYKEDLAVLDRSSFFNILIIILDSIMLSSLKSFWPTLRPSRTNIVDVFSGTVKFIF